MSPKDSGNQKKILEGMDKILKMLNVEQTTIITKISETTNKNDLGDILLELAATDSRAYEVLKQVWAMVQKNKLHTFVEAKDSSTTKLMAGEKEIKLIILKIGDDLKLDESAPTRTVFIKLPGQSRIFPIDIPIELTQHIPPWSLLEIRSSEIKDEH